MLISITKAGTVPEDLLPNHTSLIERCGFASLAASYIQDESLIETDSLILQQNSPVIWQSRNRLRNENEKTKRTVKEWEVLDLQSYAETPGIKTSPQAGQPASLYSHGGLLHCPPLIFSSNSIMLSSSRGEMRGWHVLSGAKKQHLTKLKCGGQRWTLAVSLREAEWYQHWKDDQHTVYLHMCTAPPPLSQPKNSHSYRLC